MAAILNRLRFFLPALLCLLLPAMGFADDKPASAAPPKGQRVQICGHSFHIFVAPALGKIAESAGIKDHVTVGAQMIGGSTVTQHWDLPDDKNKVKTGLTAGAFDVLTLAPHMKLVPDPAIEAFTMLGLKHNPNLRVYVQQSWMAFDDWSKPIKDNKERDQKTIDILRPPLEVFRTGLEKQAKEINAKAGKQVVFIVPAGEAVLALRAKVIAGEVPGITKQSELFRDPIGHGLEPLTRLVSYCNYAAIYRTSPVGLKVFEKDGDENARKLNRMLQEIAWKAVSEGAMSGVEADKAK
ncbi:hypothetical protein [Humisphaera borealis]|uniref:ABC transporter substrate-binding protein n=1 Tax=Humisphaera borealis TaxID=2807512 RepID=A0A7M2WW13_9BACT|nr:hypothetical protein [Humisphaera borealis]QOV89718.1 hypothetical protein IPV69_26620 [Humisphaera borealis]